LRAATIVVSVIAAAGVTLSAGEAGQRVSPHESVSGSVDDAQLTITYGRPYMRGRKIMGALVPYDEVWSPGADEATTLATSKAVRIGDVLVPPGEYSMWMLPTAEEWTLFLNKQANLFHTARRNTREDLGRIRLQKRPLMDSVEQLTFAVEQNPSGSGGVLKMTWETTELSAPITVVH
jgi:hypothetical protein